MSSAPSANMAGLGRRRTIVENAGVLMAAQGWRKGCMVVVAILVAHMAGSEALGRLLWAISFVWLFWMLVDGGISELFVRDVAAHPARAPGYARVSARMKTPLAAGALAAIAVGARAAGRPWPDVWLVFVIGLILVTESYAVLCHGWFRVQHRMHWEALWWVVDGALKLAGAGAVLVLRPAGDAMLWIAGIWWATSLLLTAPLWRWWHRAVGSGTAAPADAPQPTGRQLLARGLPLVLVTGLSLINLRGMIVLLGLWRGPAEAGYFGAGERIVEALQLLSVALAQVMLPVSARLAADGSASLDRIVRRASGAVLLGASVVGAGVWAAGGPGIRLVYGRDFGPTAAIMGYLAVATVPVLVKPVLEKILAGMHRQGLVWRWYTGVAVGCALGAYWVVPRWGVSGAAAWVAATEWVAAAGLGVVLWRLLSRPHAEAAAAWRLERVVPLEAESTG